MGYLMNIDLLTKSEIKRMFTTTTYQRGLKYYKSGRVRNLYYDPINYKWGAEVRGTQTYEVEIVAKEDGISCNCDCPAFDEYWGPCKHIAAVLLKIHERANIPAKIKSISELNRSSEQDRQAQYMRELTNSFIQTISTFSLDSDQTVQKNRKPLMVDWNLEVKEGSYRSSKTLAVQMKVGLNRTYVVKKIKEFLKAVEQKVQYPFTAKYSYDPIEQMFTEQDQEIIDLLIEAIKYDELYKEIHDLYDQSSYSREERSISIPPMLIDQLLAKFEGRTIHFQKDKHVYNQIKVISNQPPLSLKLDKGVDNGFQLDLSQLLSWEFWDFYGYLSRKNYFYKISPEQEKIIEELKKMISKMRTPILPIADDQIEPFVSQVVPVIEKTSKLEITDHVASQIVKLPLQAKMYVDRINDMLTISIEFCYGKHKIDPFVVNSDRTNGPIIMRQTGKEEEIMDIIESAPLKYNRDGLYVEGEEGIFEFLYETLPQLEEKMEIYLTQAVKSLLLPERSTPTINIDVNSTGNWLEVGFDMEDVNRQEIEHILQSVVEKKRYYRLNNGAFVNLQSDEFQTVQQIVHEFQINPRQLQDETIPLPIFRGIQLDEMLQNDLGRGAKYGNQFRRLLHHLKHPEDLDFSVPDTLQADLRDYQYNGFQWMKTLAGFKLGGILADEMGLGKTVQAIALILSSFSESELTKPALIVAPASLVYNWKNEFQKFAPILDVAVVIGSPQERQDILQNDHLPQVLITSYPTLRQDIDKYMEYEFSTFILDEAQSIKNHTTKTAKAVRQINAETCFALTGTPIENSVDELWSIFQRVIPNFFPPLTRFRQIEPEKIAKLIRPFLLRRVKKDVLKELPDKIESINYSDLTKPQKELYLAYLERIRTEAAESIQKNGFERSKIKILAGLTRLRQICCHPSLFVDNYQGDSGKLDQLMEMIENGRENGRRMLVFSQFTSMLAIIRERLEQAGVKFFYLDGQTKPKERVDMVDCFNAGEGDVFLISLKAGNTGLNLTGADTVILYDLWWNPAVEDQAAGRAHRIGQKRVVQVIRLITQGTIEEKMYELQQNKKELIDTVIQAGEEGIAKLTEEDIKEILNL